MTNFPFLHYISNYIASLKGASLPPRKNVQTQIDPMRYLKPRGAKWHYVRRVPLQFAVVDPRGTIQASLKTSSLDVAKLRRDAMERADDLYWQGMTLDDQTAAVEAKYKATKARALALGFEYKAAAEIAETSTIEEIIQRIAAATVSPRDEVAALGAVDVPRLTVRQTMNLYVEEFGLKDTIGKSASQIKRWKKVKLIAAERFCEVVADKPFLDIDRADALKFDAWLTARIKNGFSGGSANRLMGNMRKLYYDYTAHLQLTRTNPFEKLFYANPKRKRKKILPFEPSYIETTFLHGDKLKTLNREARLVFLAMTETGCRPSEIANLRPEHIHLDAEVPYISVRFEDDRELKTENSIRDVPLVGISLEVMKRAPNGFPRYFDAEDTLSDTVQTYLKKKKLLPSDNYRMYSMRHAYEKRMTEAGYSDEYRRRIMGHDIDRPEYGDGGSLAWRQGMMKAIALKFDASVLD